MNSIENFTKEVKSLKSKYGSTFFEKNGLHAVLVDLANNLDKRFISVLKKADEVSLPQKLNKLNYEDDSTLALQMSNLKQEFIENTGLDATMAAVVFDAYSFGLGLKPSFDSNDYNIQKTNNELQIIDLIKFAFADSRLNKTELNEIFARGLSMGMSDNDIFILVKKFILDHDLIALTTSNTIKPSCKEVLIGYDWVTNDLFLKIREIQLSNQREKETIQEQINSLKLEVGRKNDKPDVDKQNHKKQVNNNTQHLIPNKIENRYLKFGKVVGWFIIILLVIRGFNFFIKDDYSEKLNKSISIQRELEEIEDRIILGIERRETKVSLLNLINQLNHPDSDRYLDGMKNSITDRNNPNGNFIGTYNKYWNMKRDAYRIIVTEGINIADYYLKRYSKSYNREVNGASINKINKINNGDVYNSNDEIDFPAEDTFNYDVIEVDIDSVNH